MKKFKSGFTLIELMIAVVIIAILGGIAYPSYTKQIQKSRRSDAHGTLSSYAMKFEEFYSNNYTYTGADTYYGLNATPNSPNSFYRMSATASGDTYTITATAIGSQARDTSCAAITLDHVGNKLPAACW